MISFWHLSAVCCVPLLNPERRIREQELLQDAARKVPKHGPRVRGRWELREMALANKE
jgi:hypothetical protein